jgi:hypothetical protein
LALAFMLAVGCGTLIATALAVKRGVFRKAALNPLVAQLRKPQKITLGQSIIVQFELFNRSPHTIPVADRVHDPQARPREYDVRVIALKDGKELPDPIAFEQETTLEEAPRLIMLAPGSRKSWPLELTRFARFSEPGRYKVSITRHPYVDKIRVSAAPMILNIR